MKTLMNRLTTKDLQRVALHCGYRTDVTKSARLRAIKESGEFFDVITAKHNPKKPFNILLVDVGLKNFSYSKVSYTGTTADIKDWNVTNLHDVYGTPEHTDDGSLVDSKAYLAKLALGVVDNVFLAGLWIPNIITIENQRTRSNSKTSTLPNVLLNFCLEHMIYAAFAARQTTNSKLQPTVIMPMHANKMVNYWLSRYTAKQCLYAGLKSKTFRKLALYGWLRQPQLAPFDLSSFTKKLPPDFSSLGPTSLNSALKKALNVTRPNAKVDDLVDSLLYNLSLARQMSLHQEIKKLMEAEDKDAIVCKLAKWDKEHIKFIEPLLLSRDDLFLASEYEALE
ncbi:cruciform cutting endonuclease 1 [Metschnikowia aff. pulcherrima]|uniref:Cruciform cutting endonuclease 1 n=1 Tax=Metschnikowia aff. pulcherrima TaxID=2163413 RepID=A0A4P6XP08_9ASCO|nr:cruciform cutting endonuclease 1 [Metschnikowia aff. pulcherrima]